MSNVITLEEIKAKKLVKRLMAHFKKDKEDTKQRRAQRFLQAIENSTATTKAGRVQDAMDQMGEE